MIKNIKKEEKIALCRVCGGSGKVFGGVFRSPSVCPQCEGTGRVIVKCDMVLNIRPYKEEK